MEQINSQSDFISMLNFAGLSYLTIRSSVYIILIWDSCIFNPYNLCQTGSNYTRRRPHQCALHFSKQMYYNNKSIPLPSVRPVPAQVILLMERAAKTLHQMSPFTSVSIAAKITWIFHHGNFENSFRYDYSFVSKIQHLAKIYKS